MMLIKGLVIGFSIAAPVGPIGVLCIQRTLAKGRTVGLITGLGAATADGLYGAIAGFGLTFISSFLINHQSLIRLIGGLFLLYLGSRTFLSKPTDSTSIVKETGYLRSYSSTFFLTLTNPLTILSFMAIFAGVGLTNTAGDYFLASLLVLGVFLGSALWWLFLSFGINMIKDKLNYEALKWINKISGLIVLLFGVTALISVFSVR